MAGKPRPGQMGHPDYDKHQQHLFDEDGNFDFNAREKREYYHDYSYFGGFLGADEVKEKKKKEKLIGKCDLLPRLPPKDARIRGMIEQFASKCLQQEDPDFCEHTFFTKNPKMYYFLRENDGTSRKFEIEERTGKLIDPLKVASEKNTNSKPTTEEQDEQEKARDYYQFVKHCLQRKVDYVPLVAKQQMVEADRIAKLHGLTDINAGDGAVKIAPGGAGGGGSSSSSSSAAGAGAKNDGQENKDSTANNDADDPVKKFTPGSRVEVIGLKAKPELNGEFAIVKSYNATSERFQILFEKLKIEIAVRAGNLMFAKDQAKFQNDKEDKKWTADIPQNTKVEIKDLTSDAGKLLNGSKGIVVNFDEETKRYLVKMLTNRNVETNQIKKLKFENLKCELPKGWTEHFDEHMGKFFYRHTDSNRIQWKHPVLKQRVNRKNENKDAFGKDAFLVQNEDNIDAEFDRQKYATDRLNEGEGQFNLQDLVAKVQREEDRKRRREENPDVEIDSDLEEEQAEEEWKRQRGLVNRAKKRTKREKKDLFKYDFLVKTLQESKERLALAGNCRAAPGNKLNKNEQQAILEARWEMLNQFVENTKLEKNDQRISQGDFASSSGFYGQEAPVIVVKADVPPHLWRDCETAIVDSIDSIHKEFETDSARQKHTIQNLNLTMLYLVETDDSAMTANHLSEKMDSLLGLMKCFF
ncbi:unnamed protein product [Amoebophrya sp. A120]|nr:unnamed protein product [Amoebophrya sp. A120]|eukprot:GSA120T00024708001.1